MKKILVAMDGSEQSFKALAEAGKLAKAMKAEITAISVVHDVVVYGGYESVYFDNESLRKASEEVLRRTKEMMEKEGFAIKTILGKGNAAEVINETAESGDFDLVVMGSRGLGGVSRLLLGSVSGRVANTSKVSVLIVK
ncbi:MAG: universal stress protein [bacterium]|jgi:nucleotide-binding universal stress UspA family protein